VECQSDELAMRDSHREGWNGALDKLEELFLAAT
jgi:hypothetical protein